MPGLLLRARPMLLALFCLSLVLLSDPGALRGQPPGKFGKGKGKAGAGELKKYDEVITKDAKTSLGVFAVHRIDDKVLFEIPKDGLGRLMLWTIEVARGPAGVSWGGQS